MRDKGAKRPASGKLHIDDGCMGGGEDFPYDKKCNSTERNNIYNSYFQHGNPNHERNKIFHYFFFGYYKSESKESLGTTYGKDRTGIWTEANHDYAFWEIGAGYNGVVACTFMHELGHQLGIDRDYLGRSVSLDDYPSCMNYNSADLVDYSDGSHSSKDFNDWGELDLTYFNT